MSDLNGRRFAMVVANFYPDLAEKFIEGAQNTFVELGGNLHSLIRFDAPGAFEIPQIAEHLTRCKSFDAILCFGVVIRGETSHYDYVCENVTRGVGEIAQSADIPVIFGVLTVENKEQALARLSGENHKGSDSVRAAAQMIHTLEMVRRAR